MRCLPAALSWFHADAFPRFSKPWGSLGRLQRPKRLENLSLIVFGPDHHSISHRGNEFSRAPIWEVVPARSFPPVSRSLGERENGAEYFGDLVLRFPGYVSVDISNDRGVSFGLSVDIFNAAGRFHISKHTLLFPIFLFISNLVNDTWRNLINLRHL